MRNTFLAILIAIYAGLIALAGMAIIGPTGAKFTTDRNRVFQHEPGGGSLVLEYTGRVGQVRLSGNGVDLASPDGAFENVPAGWYSATIHRNGVPGQSIDVGVGDVYVVAGQSNSVSQVQPAGFVPAVPSGPGKVILNRFYSQGLRDVYADPLETYLYDAGVAWLYAALALDRPHPIMFVMVGLGNTSTERWAQAETYQRIIDAVETHAPKAVLWHQGESDSAVPPVPAEISYTNMAAMIDGVGGSTPWVMALNSTSSAPPEGFDQWPIRIAQQRIIDTYAHVLKGPDTDTVRVTGEVEYLGPSLAAHGNLWAATLQTLGL